MKRRSISVKYLWLILVFVSMSIYMYISINIFRDIVACTSLFIPKITIGQGSINLLFAKYGVDNLQIFPIQCYISTAVFLLLHFCCSISTALFLLLYFCCSFSALFFSWQTSVSRRFPIVYTSIKISKYRLNIFLCLQGADLFLWWANRESERTLQTVDQVCA